MKRIKAFGELIFIIFLDSVLVAIVAFITYVLKLFIEWLYQEKLDEIDNPELFYVYNGSKYLLISFFFLFALVDIVGQIKKVIKDLENE